MFRQAPLKSRPGAPSGAPGKPTGQCNDTRSITAGVRPSKCPDTLTVTAIRACGVAGGQVPKGMKKISYKGYRSLPKSSSRRWLYVRFTLSFRDVEDLLAE